MGHQFTLEPHQIIMKAFIFVTLLADEPDVAAAKAEFQKVFMPTATAKSPPPWLPLLPSLLPLFLMLLTLNTTTTGTPLTTLTDTTVLTTTTGPDMALTPMPMPLTLMPMLVTLMLMLVTLTPSQWLPPRPNKLTTNYATRRY